jgi:formylglycine-generating enzyme required for sulfatase activity
LYADPNTTRSKPVGQLLPNEYGLFDVLGNVCEWCNDLNQQNRVERATRGGAAGGMVRYMHVARMGTAQPNEEFNSNGFRIARTLPAKDR